MESILFTLRVLRRRLPEYVMSYPCPPCCGVATLNCTLCTFATRPTQWVADLGVGGLVDNGCSECDQVKGQYTLNANHDGGNCIWDFVDTNYCSASCALLPSSLDLLVSLSIVSATDWKWLCRVELRCQSGSPTGHVIEDFESTGSTDADCFDLGGDGVGNKITLTRQGASLDRFNTNAGSDAGRLPATIEVWAP